MAILQNIDLLFPLFLMPDTREENEAASLKLHEGFQFGHAHSAVHSVTDISLTA